MYKSATRVCKIESLNCEIFILFIKLAIYIYIYLSFFVQFWLLKIINYTFCFILFQKMFYLLKGLNRIN